MRDHLHVVPNKLGLQIKNTFYGLIDLFIYLFITGQLTTTYTYCCLVTITDTQQMIIEAKFLVSTKSTNTICFYNVAESDPTACT